MEYATCWDPLITITIEQNSWSGNGVVGCRLGFGSSVHNILFLETYSTIVPNVGLIPKRGIYKKISAAAKT